MTTEIPKEVQTELDKAAIAMARASSLIKEGEKIKEDVKSTVLPLMASFDIKSSESRVGKISCSKGSGSAIDSTKLTEVLLKRGIDAVDIPKIIKSSTKSWYYTYVSFKAAKSD